MKRHRRSAPIITVQALRVKVSSRGIGRQPKGEPEGSAQAVSGMRQGQHITMRACSENTSGARRNEPPDAEGEVFEVRTSVGGQLPATEFPEADGQEVMDMTSRLSKERD